MAYLKDFMKCICHIHFLDSKCNDLGSIVMYISLFLLSAPSSICKQRHLLPKILDIFEQAFMSEDIQVF